MKNILILVFLLFIPITVSGQFTSNRIIDGDLIIQSTGQVTVPSGTTAQRSLLPVNGMLRYNQDVNEFEGFVNGVWDSIGGGLELTAKGNLIGFDGVDTKECVLDKTDGYLLTVSAASDCGFDFSPAPVSVPTTTKGDLSTHNGTIPTRLGVGSDGSFLVAASAESTGLKWTGTLAGTFNPITNMQDCSSIATSWDANGTVTCKYRRNGDLMDFDITIELTSSPSGTLQVNVPNGETVDTAKLSNIITNKKSFNSHVFLRDDGTARFGGALIYNSSTDFRVVYEGFGGGGGGVGTVTSTAPFTFVNNDSVNINVSGVPISGWTNSLDAIVQNKEMLFVLAEGDTGTLINNDATNVPFTEVEDPKNAFDGTIFTVPSGEAGLYKVTGIVAYTAGVSDWRIYGYVNGSQNKTISYQRGGSDTSANNAFSGVFKLAEGDTFSIRSNRTGTTLSGLPFRHHLTIVKLVTKDTIIASLDSQKHNCQTKYLQANNTTNGFMADLTFSDVNGSAIVAGKNYSVTYQVNATSSADVRVDDGNNSISRRDVQANGVSGGAVGCFEADGTQIRMLHNDTIQVNGDGTFSTTWMQVCELPDNYDCENL